MRIEPATCGTGDYAGLHVCGDCGSIGGRFGAYQHVCRCSRDESPTWPRYDFNTAVELCRCCGQVALSSGSRFSVWFCDGCKKEIGLLHGRLGRYVVPIGRHSFHGGFMLSPEEALDPLETEIFVGRWAAIGEAMDAVHDWAGIVVRRILEERWEVVPAIL
jgi:hypothetical protein